MLFCHCIIFLFAPFVLKVFFSNLSPSTSDTTWFMKLLIHCHIDYRNWVEKLGTLVNWLVEGERVFRTG